MSPKDLVDALRLGILEANSDSYREILRQSLEGETFRDPYWAKTSALYRSLDEDGRSQLVAIMRQVIKDTLSNVLGVLDGSSTLPRSPDGFHLTYGKQGQALNIELQDIFLAACESEG